MPLGMQSCIPSPWLHALCLTLQSAPRSIGGQVCVTSLALY